MHRTLDYYNIVKPSFEIDFWLKHFRGMDEGTARGYEAFLMSPIADSMFFADTCEWYEEEYIDCIGIVEPLERKVDASVKLEGYRVDGVKPDTMKERFELKDDDEEDEEGD